ncbi:hypothetical protein HaLaN_00843 [Haematococcus lacustris]|uniref:Uncharacterized protein n=1 Tax=Haematococcus lacustris TaxID=44745 RepID=A0A699YH75_HAELA|nr:hypothetical protein HaLaN_00843 [Haematococcus lacustris]
MVGAAGNEELRRRLEERRRLVEVLEAALAEKDSQAMKAAAQHAQELQQAVARQRQEELETAARASAVAAATAEEQARMARNAFDLELLSRAAAQRSADEANVQAHAIAAELAELRVEMQALRAQVARSSLGDKELRAELEQAEDAAAVRQAGSQQGGSSSRGVWAALWGQQMITGSSRQQQ